MKKINYFVLIIFLFSSCYNTPSKIQNENDLKITMNNKDHVIALQNNKICYAKFRNLHKYDIFIFDDKEILLKKCTCTYIKESDIKKITEGMNKSTVTNILGYPAIVDENRFIYFQKFFDLGFLKFNYGIDRRIFEITFDNDVVIQTNEKYVSRY